MKNFFQFIQNDGKLWFFNNITNSNFSKRQQINSYKDVLATF